MHEAHRGGEGGTGLTEPGRSQGRPAEGGTMEKETALTLVERPTALSEWAGAATRGLEARHERERIIAEVLKPGADFGKIPGTDKPTLLKAGAEKIADSLNLCPTYESLVSIEDWEKPLFFYRYRCTLRTRGREEAVATGVGSCNSMESRYRWRKAQRRCPRCGKPTIIKGRDEYGGGWICFAKKGGCGAKFADADTSITGQEVGLVPNDDIFSLVNTIDKMGQKRALVAATLNLGFSEQFTQDMEDLSPESESEPAPVSSGHGFDGPTVSPAAARVVPTDVNPLWLGRIAEVRKKDGQKNGKPYTLYTVIGGDETKFTTFDVKLAEAAKNFAGTGEEVEVNFSESKYGKDFLGISASAQPPLDM
jgi:hypothetical protein